MWNGFQTDGLVGVTAATTTYPVGDEQIHAYVASPAGDAQAPGMVVAHHMPGWDEFYQEFCERLARHGYHVVMPDLYCRTGHGTPDDVAAKGRADGGLRDDTVVGDLAAARDWLLAQPGSTGRVGIIGSCSGGRHAVLTASRTPGFDAVVDLWGGQVVMTADQLTDARPVAPIDYAADLEAPLLGIFGNDDQSPSPADVDSHEAELTRLGKTFEFHRYDGAGHGFCYYHTARYRPEAAMDAWAKVLTFLDTNLRG